MVPVKWRSGLRSMLRLVDLVGAGFGFRGNDGIAWLVIRDLGTRGLVLLLRSHSDW